MADQGQQCPGYGSHREKEHGDALGRDRTYSVRASELEMPLGL